MEKLVLFVSAALLADCSIMSVNQAIAPSQTSTAPMSGLALSDELRVSNMMRAVSRGRNRRV